MDIGKSFAYMFEEDRWVEKLVIGGLLCLIPVVNFFAIGYALRALKNASEGKHPVLPDWDDWGADWVKGLVASLVVPAVYCLPLLFAAVPYVIVTSVSSRAYGYNTGLSVSESIGMACTAVYSCLALLWGLVVAIIYPAGTVKYARDGQFASYFRFGELYRFIKDNLADYIVAILLSVLASIAAGIVGGLVCGIGVAWTSFWSYLVMAHLFGQIGATAAPMAAGPPPAAPAPTYGELETNKLEGPTEETLGGEPPKQP